MKTSLLIPLWKRFTNLEKILSAWIPQVQEIVLWVNMEPFNGHNVQAKVDFLFYHPVFATQDMFTWVCSSKNYGGQIKFMTANLLHNDFVVISDDDIIPGKNVVAQYKEYLSKLEGNDKDKVLSVFGRKLSPKGYRACPLLRGNPGNGKQIKEPAEVDFVGRMYFGHRSNFHVDMQGCDDTRVDDLWWCWQLRKLKPHVRFYVVPIADWKDSPEANDEASISRLKDFWQVRDRFVQKHCKEMIRER